MDVDLNNYLRDVNFLAQWFPQQFHDYINTLNDEQAEILAENLEHERKYNKLSLYLPYGHAKTLDIPGWSKKPWQVQFHNNTDKERMLMCANGVGKCLTNQVLIETSDGKKRICDVFGKKISVPTYPDGQLRPVINWVIKPKEECFRITLSDGQWIECPRGHKILTTSGWRTASSILDSLPESVFCRPQTSSALSRLTHVLDVRHYMRSIRDYLGDCLVGFRLHGAQLLSDEDSVRVFAPLPDDARKHNSALSYMGDLARKYTDTLLGFLSRFSTQGFYRLAFAKNGELGEYRASCRLFELWRESNLSNLPPESVLNGQPQSVPGVNQYPLAKPLDLSANEIVSAYSIGVKTLYDMEVAQRHNYFAGGLIHHNSISGAYETAIHMTGMYPDWWEGHRFTKPPKFWIGSITNEVQKDYIQSLLLGEAEMGTGFIPKNRLIGKPTTRQCGISGVYDTFKVRHISGGISIGQFKTYEQGWRKWQAAAPNGIWLDEEPNEGPDQKPIFSECQTRVVRTSGIIYVTYTPLLGQTDLTDHFMNPKAKGISSVTATWNDAPHLNAEDKQRLIDTYPEHEREARTQGVPMMGEGRVFTTSEADIKIAPFEIPPYFARIKGIDFGIDHPCASAEIAWDRDKDVIYIIRTWKKKGADGAEHADKTNNPNPWVPVSWPHDGTQREKSSGKQLKDIYRDKYGVRLLSLSARYDNDKGGGQPAEPIILEINERCRTGGFKVFNTCTDFFDEYRNYHRKNGILTKTRDDVLKAVMYAMMMRRYAVTQRLTTYSNHQPRAFSTG